MRKILIFLILMNLSLNIISQSFEGSWININPRRIDNSKILKPNAYKGAYKYVIRDKKIFEVDTPGNHMITGFAEPITIISQNKANTPNLNLELISDSILIITQKHSVDEIDKKNKYTLIKENYYFEQLKSKNLVRIENDSLIISNEYIFPFYESKYFNKHLSNDLLSRIKQRQGSVSGYFIILKNGEITNIEVQNNYNFIDVENLKKTIQASKQNWVLPIPNYSYLVYFTIAFNHERNCFVISYKKDDFEGLKESSVSNFDVELWNKKENAFKKGTKLAQNQKYKEAIKEFTFCITVDPLDVDLYYNRAFCYYNINMHKEACLDWEFLTKMEQTTATKIYNENCKKN